MGGTELRVSMASLKQIEANRQNALSSTGPRTEQGKKRSRRNALRHGLTAETVIEGFEDPNDYRAFEDAVMADYNPRSTVERELVLRLASLLWRLRRATAIEAGLLAIQTEIHRERRQAREFERHGQARRQAVIHNILDAAIDRGRNKGRRDGPHGARESPDGLQDADKTGVCRSMPVTSRDLAQCFLRLANLDERMLERIGHYELRLWRQAAQTIFALEALKRSRAN